MDNILIFSHHVSFAGVEFYSIMMIEHPRSAASDFILTGKGTLLAKLSEGFQMAQLVSYDEMHGIAQRCTTRYCLITNLEGPQTNPLCDLANKGDT